MEYSSAAMWYGPCKTQVMYGIRFGSSDSEEQDHSTRPKKAIIQGPLTLPFLSLSGLAWGCPD